MKSHQPQLVKTIGDYHRLRELPRPAHPLISVINLDTTTYGQLHEPISLVFDFYAILDKTEFRCHDKVRSAILRFRRRDYGVYSPRTGVKLYRH